MSENQTQALISEEDLSAIEARCEAATKGPWKVDESDGDWILRPSSRYNSLMGNTTYYPWVPEKREDWDFIAAARTDLPRLLAEVRRLRDDAALGALVRRWAEECQRRDRWDCYLVEESGISFCNTVHDGAIGNTLEKALKAWLEMEENQEDA